MNAIELLTKDHEQVRHLLQRLSETTNRASKLRPELLEKLERLVAVHTRLEEQLLYPRLKEAGGEDAAIMYYEAKEEHRAVDSLVLPDLKNTEPTSEEFAGRVKVCKELLEHHVEEEEKELFPCAEQLLGKEGLEKLGEEMQALKRQLQAEHE